MGHRLENAVSPYLRSHADNPVDWWPWSAEAFEAARHRDVPVLISIGYATCHWCHVMARETFSDPAVGAWLNERVVAIKVDREEHPEVDSAYLTAAGAFTEQLGWPLTIFATPSGQTFYAATYLPPQPLPQQGVPSFRQLTEAVLEAWTERREEVLQSATGLQEAIRSASTAAAHPLPTSEQLDAAVAELEQAEDTQYGGFGGAPKFPVAPTVLFLLARGAMADARARDLAHRTLSTLAASDLRDPVEGGYFRYSTRRDWSEPHYERMLVDNALLLRAHAIAGQREAAAGVVGFLRDVLRVPGGFASGQDSESIIDGVRNEGGYYALDAEGRRGLAPPPLDDKVLTGLTGIAIGALAVASRLLGEPTWAQLASEVAAELLDAHVRRNESGEPVLVRASRDGEASAASPTLEDYGSLASGLPDLAVTTGDEEWAKLARQFVDACERAGQQHGRPAAVPGGGDPVLAALDLVADEDATEGAAPSGVSTLASAALALYHLTGEAGYRTLAESLIATVAVIAVERPLGFGAALGIAAELQAPSRQLIVVTSAHPASDDPLVAYARREWRPGQTSIALSVADAERWSLAGFATLGNKALRGDNSTAYACTDFICRLPVTEVAELRDA